LCGNELLDWKSTPIDPTENDDLNIKRADRSMVGKANFNGGFRLLVHLYQQRRHHLGGQLPPR